MRLCYAFLASGLFYLLMAVPAIFALTPTVGFFEYVDEPSYLYHNLVVYDGVLNPVFMGRVIAYINATAYQYRLPGNPIFVGNVTSIGSDAVEGLLRDLGITNFSVLGIKNVVTVLLSNSTYEKDVAILHGHAEEIGRVYAEAVEAGLRDLGRDVRIDRVAVVAVRLPIDLTPSIKEKYSFGLASKINREVYRLNGGRRPSWYYGAVSNGLLVEVILMKPGFREEGTTLNGALDQVREAVRRAAGGDIPIIVNVSIAMVEEEPLTYPTERAIWDVRLILAIFTLIFVIAILMGGLILKRGEAQNT